MIRRLPRFFAPILLGLAGFAFAAAPPSLSDENENYRQLQDMPLERRVALLENLEKFDKLDRAEQSRIRKLNAEIASKDPVNQLKYRSLMRRYQLWLSGLTDEQKEKLRTTDDPQDRFKLALEYRKQEIQAGSSAERIHGIRSGYYGLMGPYEVAHLLRVWHKMDSAKRFNVEKLEGRGKLEIAIREMGKDVGLNPPIPFPHAEERKYDAILDANNDFKKQLGRFADRVEVRSKANDAAKAKGEHVPTRFEQKFAEFRYFEDHKPKSVKQQNLEKFSAFCPNWFHTMLDPLSADDARNYMTIVYRLIFPEPTEITDDWKPAKERTEIKPGTPRPTQKRSTTPAPL